MKLSTQPYKGARDFYPEYMRLEQYIFKTWRSVCQSYGYEEYDAPILEPTELYLSKGSQEIVNEQTFSFKDRGGRSVTLRTEMTPTVSRMVAAKRQELSYPLRWFSIPQCWRYERTQRGRGREFYQLNVDIFGVDNLDADFEMIQMADAIMKAFAAKAEMYEIRVNSRVELNQRIAAAQVKTSLAEVMRLIDKFDKLDNETFLKELAGQVALPDELYNYLTKGGEPPVLLDLLARAKQVGIKNIKFVPTIARGFDYYTDVVFEVFDTDPENNRAMFGGGRYDGLVELFGVEAVPTVGFGMGDITLKNFLETHNLLPNLDTPTDIYAVLIGDVFTAAQKPLEELRAQGVNVALDSTGRKIDRQLKNATKKGIKYALFIGEKELQSGKYELKNLQSGDSKTLSLEEIINMFKKVRRES